MNHTHDDYQRAFDAATSLLDLMSQEASPDALDAVIDRCRSEGIAAELIDRVEEAARPVIAGIERRRRREQEALALLETSIDLGELHELDELLHAIVSRAKRLLRADVAYLDLVDELSDETYHRVTIGCYSQRFKDIRMSVEDGLGGLVTTLAAPVTASDYLNEDRFTRTDAINEAITEEGIVSLLGVPLMVSGAVMGVLYIAERTPRVFTADEIAFTGSLAAQAAIAYENARLLDRMHTAIEDLNAANEVISGQSASVELAADFHVQMTSLVLHGGDLHDLADVLADTLGGAPVSVVDALGMPLAASRVHGAAALDAAIQEALAGPRNEASVAVGSSWLAWAPPAEDSGGAIVVQPPTEISDSDKRLLERAALVLALLLMIRKVILETEMRQQRDLLDDLLASDGSNGAWLQERASAVGAFGADHEFCIVVATVESPIDPGETVLAWARGTGTLAGQKGGRYVFAVPGSDPQRAAETVSAGLARATRIPTTSAGAGPVTVSGDVGRVYSDALSCLDAMQRLDLTGRASTPAGLGVAGLLISPSPDSAAFIRSVLGPVLDYDARRGTELLRTIDAFLASGRSLAETSRTLNVHLNTLRQRLDRVSDLLGTGWQSRDALLDIEVALRIRRIQTA